MKRWLDGPRTFLWLDTIAGPLLGGDAGKAGMREGTMSWDGVVRPELSTANKRTLRHWRAGATANVYVLDGILIRLGRHLHEVPDDLYLEHFSKKKERRNSTPQEREVAIKALRSGLSEGEVARRMNRSRRSVSNWKAKATA